MSRPVPPTFNPPPKISAPLLENAHGGCETPVDTDLQPSFSPQKISIPASSMDAQGTGSGIEGEGDYMATPPKPTVVELDGSGPIDIEQEGRSGADGDKGGSGLLKKVNWKYVGIGAAVAVVAIVVIKKYKLLK